MKQLCIFEGSGDNNFFVDLRTKEKKQRVYLEDFIYLYSVQRSVGAFYRPAL